MTTTTTAVPNRGARRFAYLGVVAGLLVSVAANIAHSFVAPAGWPTGARWVPEPGAVLGAMFWPVALLLTTEILTRKRWPAGWVWLLVRLAGLLPVAGVAAVISYQHLHGLLLHYWETPLAAAIGPLSIDGLMVMASAALIAPDRTDTPAAKSTTTTATSAAPVAAGASSSASPDAAAATSPGLSGGTLPDPARASSPGSSRRSSPPSPRRSPAGSSAASSTRAGRADDETLRALVAQARDERPGAGEPAVRRLLADAGLAASAARVRAALAAPPVSATSDTDPAPVTAPGAALVDVNSDEDTDDKREAA